MSATFAIILILSLCGSIAGTDSGSMNSQWIPERPQREKTPVSATRGTYSGTMRIYVTESNSRWTDPDSRPYHNGFLSFAVQEDFSLGEEDSVTWVVDWHGEDHFDADGLPYSDIQEDNVRVIAAVFDAEGYTGYSDPPTGNEFTVHEIDACAAAECGSTGYNLTNASFTHTVLVEDGTGTW